MNVVLLYSSASSCSSLPITLLFRHDEFVKSCFNDSCSLFSDGYLDMFYQYSSWDWRMKRMNVCFAIFLR